MKDIQYILSNFTINNDRNIVKIHQKNYRYLLPENINKFLTYKKFTKNNKAYDLYGWYQDSLIDI